MLAWFSFSDHALLEVRADSIGIGSKRSGRNEHHTLGVVDKSKHMRPENVAAAGSGVQVGRVQPRELEVNALGLPLDFFEPCGKYVRVRFSFVRCSRNWN